VPVPPVVAMPKARLFASRDEKAFVRGLTAYMRGDHQTALLAFQDSMARDTAEAHIAEEYFASFCLVASDRIDEAIDLVRKVIASPVEVPDALMRRYRVGGEAQIMVTPEIRVHLPHSSLAAALLLAELLQHSSKA
jgi:hypothetical protein